MYMKQSGSITIKVVLTNYTYGSKVTGCKLLVNNREQFSLGYIVQSKTWHCSTCFSNYEEVKKFLPMLQEMLDIFDDGEFTDKELRLLGYNLSSFGY